MPPSISFLCDFFRLLVKGRVHQYFILKFYFDDIHRCDVYRILTINSFSLFLKNSVPEIIDPVFAKTSQNARFLLSENERFGLVFVKTVSINSGTGWFGDHLDTFRAGL